MARRGNVSRNALAAVAQMVLSGLTLFLIYRFLLQELGAELLGVWSLVLATTSASRVSELGLAAGAVKFVADAIEQNDEAEARKVVETSVLSVALVLSVCLVLVTPLLLFWLERVVPAEQFPTARQLLPYALGSIWISSVGGVIHSSLDGCHRADIRALIAGLGAVVYFLAALIFVPRVGLIGAGLAQLAQAIFMGLTSWIALRRQLKSLPAVPYHWDRKLFRRMLGYGANFQIISITLTLYEPITKSFVTTYGGLSATAYYEMANRMVLQVRGMILSANRVLVPTVASVRHAGHQRLVEFYAKTYRIIFFLSVIIFMTLLACTPIISRLWVGHDNSPFNQFALIIIVANMLSSFAGPAYFMNLGTGVLRWNVIAHVVISLLTVICALALGPLLGATGAVAAAGIGMVVGGGIMIWGHYRQQLMQLTALVPREAAAASIMIIIWAALSFALGTESLPVSGRQALAISAVTGLIVAAVVWNSPLRSEITSRLQGGLKRRASSDQLTPLNESPEREL
jgi:O-antigen/teichoic acid export membrane protein